MQMTCNYIDGALLLALRIPFGYWEAKDEVDDASTEIGSKWTGTIAEQFRLGVSGS